MQHPRQVAFALGMAGLAAAAGGVCCYQLTRMLWAILRESYNESTKALLDVAARINSDSPEDFRPEELAPADEFFDEQGGVWVHGMLQELYYRRNRLGPTDWQWSYDAEIWHNTDDLAQDEVLLLDPPSLIFITRLHLMSVARRKAAGSAAGRSTPGAGQSRQHGPRIPPPVPLPAWAQQELASTSRACSSSLQQEPPAGRRLLDAPDVLCCPITGQVMRQPVVSPCGKTYEWTAIKKWITERGKDPHSDQPLGLNQLYPNLLVREMVERWLQTGEAVDCSGAASGMQQQHLRQQLGLGSAELQQQGSEDPLSSFGASRSSSLSSIVDNDILLFGNGA